MANEFIDDTFMDGFKDGPHVTEVQTGLANQGLYGPDDYVLEGGKEAEAQILTNNSIRIFDAVCVLQGRRDVIAANDYTDVSIDNGAQGLNRNDIIVRRYTKDESSEVESTEYAVIKGTAVSGEANDPEVTEGDIRSGATLHEMKLYRVKIEGLNIVAVEPLFKVLYNMSHIKELLSELNGKTLSQKIADYNISTIKGSVAYDGKNAGYYCRTGNHVYASGYLNILNSNDASIVVSLPFKPAKATFVARAFKGTGTYIQSYGESGGLLLACGTGQSKVYFSVDYVCTDD